MTIDTACSSSLVVLHEAVSAPESRRDRDGDRRRGQRMLTPETSWPCAKVASSPRRAP
ncbi:MAG: hypothetical protein IPG94_22225 [Kineosporiaceae bacterium]|nr:hypothetical protein [Kineosporiaceae bacterium]